MERKSETAAVIPLLDTHPLSAKRDAAAPRSDAERSSSSRAAIVDWYYIHIYIYIS